MLNACCYKTNSFIYNNLRKIRWPLTKQLKLWTFQICVVSYFMQLNYFVPLVLNFYFPLSNNFVREVSYFTQLNNGTKLWKMDLVWNKQSLRLHIFFTCETVFDNKTIEFGWFFLTVWWQDQGGHFQLKFVQIGGLEPVLLS